MIDRSSPKLYLANHGKGYFNRLSEWLTARGDLAYIGCLSIIAIATHLIWFTPGTTLFHADWSHGSSALTQHAWEMEGPWKNFLNFGAPNVQIGYFFVTFLWPIIASFGGSYDDAVKLTIMIPIAILGFAAPYLAMRKITEAKPIALIAALFYGTTTYFLLRQGAHLQIAFVYAFAPIVFTLLIAAFEKMKLKNWLFFDLAFAVSLCYEVRITFILCLILGLYVLFFHLPSRDNIKPLVFNVTLTALVLVGLSSFWLLPTYLGGLQSAITSMTSTGLFGGWLFDLPHAIALSSSAWTGSKPNEAFDMEPILPYLWLIPVIAFLPLAIRLKISSLRRKQLLFFLTLTILGIFLTKMLQEPLPQAYPWLYGNVPGFSLFREASKFNLLTAWGYMGLLTVGLVALKGSYRKFTLGIAVLILVVAGVNLYPLATGKIGTLFVARHIPHDYVLVNNLIATSPGFFRTLWVPSDSQWGFYDTAHPRINAALAMQQDWSSLFTDDQGKDIHQKFKGLFDKPFSQTLVDMASVKFVIVPLRDSANESDYFPYYGNNRAVYIDTLDHVPWLKRINIGTEEVVVYENRNYRPYITATTDLTKLPSLTNLKQAAEFTSQNYSRNNFSFALNNKNQVKQGTEVRDLFTNLQASNVHKGTVTTTAVTSNNATLQVNTNKPSISYKVNRGRIELSATKQSSLRINGQRTENTPNSDQSLGSGFLTNRHYFVAMGDKIVPVDPRAGSEHNLGFTNGTVRLLSTDDTNLISNPSLEKGLWQRDAQDCDPYDKYPGIVMNLSSTEHSEGKQSVELDAFTHDACTNPPPIPVAAGREYLLSFDYKALHSSEIGYQIIFNDTHRTTIKELPTVENDLWHTVRRTVVAPKGATSLTIKLLGVADPQSPYISMTYFDNLILSRSVIDLETQLDTTPHYTTIPIEAGKSSFTYLDPSITGQNLIPNPSLEDGLWQKKVGDCNAYDSNPALKMSIGAGDDGKNSLQLSAQRHIACTGTPNIPIQENTSYLIGFDHESPNAQSANYNITFNDPNNTTMYGSTPTTTHWQAFTRIITTPPGARTIRIVVNANAPQDGSEYTVNRYDNFKLLQVPNIEDQYYLVEHPIEQTIKPKRIDFTLVSPAKKLVHIQGAKGPFYLTMSEAYHPRWRLELDNSRATGLINGWNPRAKPNAVPASDHIKWDDFMNGWYVDPVTLCQANPAGCTRQADGSYDLSMIIEFSSQRWFYAGALMSILTLGGVVTYIILDRKHRHHLTYRARP